MRFSAYGQPPAAAMPPSSGTSGSTDHPVTALRSTTRSWRPWDRVLGQLLAGTAGVRLDLPHDPRRPFEGGRVPARPPAFGGGGYRPPATSYGYRPAAPPPPQLGPRSRPPSRGWSPSGTPGPLRWRGTVVRPKAVVRGRPVTGRVVQPIPGHGMKTVAYIKGRPVSVAPYRPPQPAPGARASGWRKAASVIASVLRLGHAVEERLPRVPHVDSAPMQSPVPPRVVRQAAGRTGPPRRRSPER